MRASSASKHRDRRFQRGDSGDAEQRYTHAGRCGLVLETFVVVWQGAIMTGFAALLGFVDRGRIDSFLQT